jgi:hypothetical protein
MQRTGDQSVITPSTIGVDTLAVISMLKLRFPTMQNPKLSRQGNKWPCWFFTYQRNGKITCLNFDGTLNQQALISKLDAELSKAGLGAAA